MIQTDILLLGVLFGTQIGLLLIEVLGSNTFGFLTILFSMAGIVVSAAWTALDIHWPTLGVHLF
jgi:hypothetical protein